MKKMMMALAVTACAFSTPSFADMSTLVPGANVGRDTTVNTDGVAGGAVASAVDIDARTLVPGANVGRDVADLPEMSVGATVGARAETNVGVETLVPGANVGQTTELGGETAVGARG